MKEITREDWMKNPTPRMMWVWDDNEAYDKKYVIYVSSVEEIENIYGERKDEYFPVRTLGGSSWKHCAEIEEPQQRRMTYKELSWWLRDHPEEHREWKYDGDTFVCIIWGYDEESAEEEVEGVLIRSNGGEWHEPLKECEE